MPLVASTLSFECDETSRDSLSVVDSSDSPIIYQANVTNIRASLFEGEPSSATFITDISNILSARLIVRKNHPQGTVLIDSTATLDGTTTHTTWSNGTKQHLLFELTDVETNQAVPSDGTLDIYAVIEVTTAEGSVVVGFFNGSIDFDGITGVDNPVLPDTGARNANFVYAGPTSGVPALPTFRALVSADIPGGGGGSGTVTSIAFAAPNIFSVSGSPINISGTITLGLATQTANTIWAGPSSGSAATPTFRSLVAMDIPNITEAQVTNLVTDLAAKLSSIPVSNTIWVDAAASLSGLRGRLDRPFSTLSAAAAVAVAGDLILVLSDLTYSGAVQFNVSVTVDFRGHKITAASQTDTRKLTFSADNSALLNYEIDCLWDGSTSTTTTGSAVRANNKRFTSYNGYIHDVMDKALELNSDFTDSNVSRLKVVNTLLHGLYANSQNVTVTNPKFSHITTFNTGEKGIAITRGGAETNQVYGVDISHCDVETVGNTNEGYYLHGLTNLTLNGIFCADSRDPVSLDTCDKVSMSNIHVWGGRSDQYCGIELAWCRNVSLGTFILDGSAKDGTTSNLGTAIVASTLSGLAASSAAGPFELFGANIRGGWANALSMTYVYGVNIVGGTFSADKIAMAFTACGRVQVSGALLETASVSAFTVPLNIDSGASSNDSGYSSVGLNRNYQFIGNFFNASSGATNEVRLLSQNATDTLSHIVFKNNKKLDAQSFATPILSTASGGGSISNVIIEGNTLSSGWNNDANTLLSTANSWSALQTYTAGIQTNILGVGTSAPVSDLHITTDGTLTSRGFTVDQHNSGVNAGLFNFRKSRGTLASPTTVVTGDYTGFFFFKPYVSTSGYITTAGFGTRVNGTVTSTSAPTELFFYTSGGSNDQDPITNGTVRLYISPTGGVSIGGTTNAGAGNLLVSGLTASSFIETDSNKVLVSKTASEMRTDLGLVIGTNVQAYDADLTTWAGITPGTGVGTFLATPSSANLAAAVTDEVGYSTGAKLVFNQGPTIYDNAATPVVAADFNLRRLKASDGTTVLFWDDSAGISFGGSQVNLPGVTVGSIIQDSVNGLKAIDLDNHQLVASNGSTVAMDWSDTAKVVVRTALGLRDTSAAFDVLLAATSSTTLTADRTLTLNMGNVAHTLAFGTTANTITFPNAASGTVAFLNLAQTWTAAQTNSTSGAASTPAMKYSGVPFAGTGTTSFPLVYINDANATASTTLNTAGTYFGVNGDGTQDLMNLFKDGTSVFKVASTGSLAFGGNAVSVTNTGGNDLTITAGQNLKLGGNAAAGWYFSNGGHFLALTDNSTSDIGAVNATRPRNLYIAQVGEFDGKDSATNAVRDSVVVAHQTSGTPANGLGSAILFNINSSTTADQNAARIAALWTDATHATRTADIVFYGVSSAAALAETFRVKANGVTVHTAPSRYKGYTVAGLPTGTQGDRAFVTDALAPAFLATAVGGGAVVTPVFYNGTNWVAE